LDFFGRGLGVCSWKKSNAMLCNITRTIIQQFLLLLLLRRLLSGSIFGIKKSRHAKRVQVQEWGEGVTIYRKVAAMHTGSKVKRNG
jgi:hypothetical protein